MEFERIEVVGDAAIWAATSREEKYFGVVFGRNDDVAFEPHWDEVAWYSDLGQVRGFLT